MLLSLRGSCNVYCSISPAASLSLLGSLLTQVFHLNQGASNIAETHEINLNTNFIALDHILSHRGMFKILPMAFQVTPQHRSWP